jgi:hypothetical protein
MDLIKELVLSMDHIPYTHYMVIGLVTWQDARTTIIFLTVATLMILHFEVVVPLMMLAAAAWLL